jgi:hypothetical protein
MADSFADQFNTPLPTAEEERFQGWVGRQSTAAGRNLENDLEDYDLRGWWKQNNGKPLGEGHLTDEFKKPNHPTFSTDSKYSGTDGFKGGSWVKDSGAWTFRPGETNLKMFSPDQLQSYFSQFEPDAKLVLPK